MSQDDGYHSSSHRDLPPLPPSLDPRIDPPLDQRLGPRSGGAQGRSGRRGARHGRHYASGGPLHKAATYTLRGLAVLLAVVTLGSAGWASYLHGVAENNVTRTEAIPSKGNVDQPGVDGQAMNLLLVGNDSRAGATEEQLANDLRTEADSGLNTDTMLLMHVPADGSRASVVSFPRDSYVQIPGYGEDKLNAAYAYGYTSVPDNAPEAQKRAAGQQLLVQTISQLSGLKIDHYVEVGLMGFFNIANLVGGVEVNLCAPVDDEFSGLSLPAGPQTISGADALAFVRQRHGLENGDLDRIRRQQYFLGAVARKLMTTDVLLNPTKQHDLIVQISQNLTVDTGLDLFQVAEQLQNLVASNLEFRTVPLADPKFGTVDGMDVVLLAPDAQIKSFFAGLSAQQSAAPTASAGQTTAPGGETTDPPPAPATLAPSEVTVEVLNGSGVDGAAAGVASTLGSQGFQVSTVGDAARTDYANTVILYAPGQEAAATTLQAAVPGSTLQTDSTVGSSVRLIVGLNDPSAGGTGAPAAPAPPPPPDLTAADTGCIN